MTWKYIHSLGRLFLARRASLHFFVRYRAHGIQRFFSLHSFFYFISFHFIYLNRRGRQIQEQKKIHIGETQNRRDSWDIMMWLCTHRKRKEKNAHKIQCLTESIIAVTHQLLFRFVPCVRVRSTIFLTLHCSCVRFAAVDVTYSFRHSLILRSSFAFVPRTMSSVLVSFPLDDFVSHTHTFHTVFIMSVFVCVAHKLLNA